MSFFSNIDNEKSNILISEDIEQTINKIDSILKIGKSFDLLKKNVYIGNRKGAIYFINGFCEEDIMEKMQEYFTGITPEQMPDNVDEFSDRLLPYVEVQSSNTEYEIVTNILSGVVCLILERYDKALFIDCRTYPMRGVQEPDKYKVLRGSRDGFVETLVSNTALVRRRIRSTDFVCEVMRAGKNSRTDIAICYMDSRVDRSLLDEIKTKINNITVDALAMNQESLVECLYRKKWYNPFPKFRFSERPDTVAASIFEGHIAILVDNSPAAILLPTTIFDVIEEADDYYFPPITGTYLRFSRAVITLISMFLTPVFLLLIQNEQWIPEWLKFIVADQVINIPIVFQLFLLEIAIDGLKLAAINTPNTLNTPFSLIAALVIGDFAVGTGWFNPQPMLYMAIVAIANFTHENYEFAYAVKFMRMLLLILTAVFDIWGFVAGIVIILAFIAGNKTISGTSYIYPLYPFDGRALLNRFFRTSINEQPINKKNEREEKTKSN